MSKYEQSARAVYTDPMRFLSPDETVLWRGKPKKSAFIMNKAAVMFLPALIWLLFDGTFIVMMFATDEMPKEMLWFIIPFFAIHLMPVWIWLANILTAKKKWDNTEYLITDHRIFIQSGFIGMDYQTLSYKDIQKVNLKVGILDRLLKVGDIHFATRDGDSLAILDVEEAVTLYPRIQKTVMDIQADIEYPNAFRPTENPGYTTQYPSNFDR